MPLVARYRRLLPIVGSGLLVVLLLLPWAADLAVLVQTHTVRGFGDDFRVFWKAARAVGHGRAPYDPVGLAHMHRVVQGNLRVPYPDQAWAVYPPALYVVLVPLGLLPWYLAAALGMAAFAATPFLALRVMGVRDWRCFLIVYATLPVFTSVILGAISTVLMLAFALIWRGRAAVATGAAAIVAKLFLWPIAVVLAALLGMRRGVILVASAFAGGALSWAVIGFADITRYPTMLSDLSAGEAHDSLSVVGLAYAFGAPPAVGAYAGPALGFAVAALAYRAGRRRRHDTALTLALVAALLASPIVWMHYLTLLLIPLCARYPRFHAAWLLPLLYWFVPSGNANGKHEAFYVVWPIAACIVVICLLPEGAATRWLGRVRAAIQPARLTALPTPPGPPSP